MYVHRRNLVFRARQSIDFALSARNKQINPSMRVCNIEDKHFHLQIPTPTRDAQALRIKNNWLLKHIPSMEKIAEGMGQKEVYCTYACVLAYCVKLSASFNQVCGQGFFPTIQDKIEEKDTPTGCRRQKASMQGGLHRV